MTREEAFRKLKKHKINIRKSELVDLKVVCYDLVCKNCKWFNKVGLAGYSCSNKENKKMFGGRIIWIDENFGCNRFERKRR